MPANGSPVRNTFKSSHPSSTPLINLHPGPKITLATDDLTDAQREAIRADGIKIADEFDATGVVMGDGNKENLG